MEQVQNQRHGKPYGADEVNVTARFRFGGVDGEVHEKRVRKRLFYRPKRDLGTFGHEHRELGRLNDGKVKVPFGVHVLAVVQSTGHGASDVHQPPRVGPVAVAQRVQGGQGPRAGRAQGGQAARPDRQAFGDLPETVRADGGRPRVTARRDRDERDGGRQRQRYVQHGARIKRERGQRRERQRDGRRARE